MDGEAGTDMVTRPRGARGAGERRGATVGGDGAQLPRLPFLVVGEHAPKRLVGFRTPGELVQDARAVRRHAGCLRGDGAEARAGPRDHRADREVLRLHCAPDLACLEVGRDDREGAVRYVCDRWRSR